VVVADRSREQDPGAATCQATRTLGRERALAMVELNGFKPMAIGGAVRSRAIPLFDSQCAQPARGTRLLDRDRRPRLGCSLWLRFPAARRSPRLRRIEVEQRRSQHLKVFSRERVKTTQAACHGRSAGLACELDDCPCPEHIANGRLPFRWGFDNNHFCTLMPLGAPSIPSFHNGAATPRQTRPGLVGRDQGRA
jgi:hypothetical protein